MIDVGKAPGSHTAAQEAINALLVEHAQRGSVVVRLKGGDPFVFGRGSEEVDACVAAGVAVEVVPGLTSPVAAATLAGIPLTERGTTQQFTVVSGHVPPGDPRSTVDWQSLAAADATLVLMMAVANLEPDRSRVDGWRPSRRHPGRRGHERLDGRPGSSHDRPGRARGGREASRATGNRDHR